MGGYRGKYSTVVKGDTGSLDYTSHGVALGPSLQGLAINSGPGKINRYRDHRGNPT